MWKANGKTTCFGYKDHHQVFLNIKMQQCSLLKLRIAIDPCSSHFLINNRYAGLQCQYIKILKFIKLVKTLSELYSDFLIVNTII
jgi:hypothetical protein